ncbi:hypothetical protein P2G88_19040 [Aliiglaciecola sp. CAU 1673]|uniref:hypothetical protein n=1 Tax=Aliiglaciecola sp. CAU 1673 TaxID=3032595 RepID=UPI0023D9EA92|nr:hypothetical protein [Aliiglaciecola sp. CAU 1673]MDF2180359.1 hypothetical protein [Aliiglaciecola sp. CAU 1673]
MKHLFSKSLIALAAGAYSLSALAIQPSPYYVVADDYIAQHLVHEHEAALKDFKQQADKVGFKDHWLFYQFDDGRHAAFNPQQSHDYQATDEQNWSEVADKFDPEFLKTNGQVYRRTISNQDFLMMRYNEELSLEPDTALAAPLSHMVMVEIDLHMNASVKEHLKEWIKQEKQHNDRLHFSAYSKSYGSNLPTLYLAFHASSFIDFYQRLEKRGVFDPVQLLPNDFKEGIKAYKVSLGKHVPEISY